MPGSYIKLIFGTRPWDFEARFALATGSLGIALPPSTAPSPSFWGRPPFKQKKTTTTKIVHSSMLFL